MVRTVFSNVRDGGWVGFIFLEPVQRRKSPWNSSSVRVISGQACDLRRIVAAHVRWYPAHRYSASRHHTNVTCARGTTHRQHSIEASQHRNAALAPGVARIVYVHTQAPGATAHIVATKLHHCGAIMCVWADLVV